MSNQSLGSRASAHIMVAQVTDKLPRPNLVLLKHLLSLLHHISQNAEANRMDSSNLAICIGPNLLSPGTDNALPLEEHKEMNDKVTVLVEFLINNCLEIFEEDIAFPACALAEESPEHTDSSTGTPSRSSNLQHNTELNPNVKHLIQADFATDVLRLQGSF